MDAHNLDIIDSILKKYVASIRPTDPEIRKQIDLGYSFDGKIVELFEIRPRWDNSKEFDQHAYAKLRYYKRRKEWNLYWKRASGKWELYEPFPYFTHLTKALEVIEEDSYACFYG